LTIAEEKDICKHITAENFNNIVMQEGKEVLLMVYAPWCGHC